MQKIKEKLYNQNNLLSWIILIALAFIWGSSFILIKKGLTAFSATQVGTLRIAFAFIVMLPFAIKNLNTVFKEYWKKILLLGLVANLIPAILFAVAETGLSSSLAGILNSLTPIMTLIAGVLLFKTQIKFLQTIGLAIGFIGSFALVFVGNSGEFGEFNHFALYVILATMMYGFSGNFIKTSFAKVHPLTLAALAMFSVGPISIVYLAFTDFPTRLVSHPSAMSSLGYLFLLGAIGTAFALVLFNRLIQMTTAVFASSVTYLIPIMAVVWGILDGESFYAMHIVGMFLIIAGVFLTNKFR